MKTVKTGIADLDEFLMGGLPSENHSSHRFTKFQEAKSLLRQVLFNRAKMCPVTYFTVSVSAESVREDLARLRMGHCAP